MVKRKQASSLSFEDVITSEMRKQHEKIIYCGFCGNEILKYAGKADIWENESENKAHIECVRKYQHEQELRVKQLMQEEKEKTEAARRAAGITP